MGGTIDAWTLKSVSDQFNASVSRATINSGNAAFKESLDIDTLNSIGQDIKGNKDRLREACDAYGQYIPPASWPKVLAGVTNIDKRWLKKYGLVYDSQINKNWLKLGIISFRCPPHAAFLKAVAEISQVKVIAFPESPVTIIEPRIAEPMMVDVRGMVGVDDRIQEQYGRGIRVAIVDTGIDPYHPDFPNINYFSCANFTHDSDYLDYCGHGTHVAGIALGGGMASGGKYKGIAPNCDFIVAKVLSNEGYGYTEWIINGMAWCAYEQNAQIMNLSLGGNGYPDGRSLLSVAVENLCQQGYLMCCAAGNNGPELETIGQPADAHSTVSVGAIDKSYLLTDFSSRGSADKNSPVWDKPNIVAPGHYTIAPRSQYCDFPVYENYYTSLSGTSMATPVLTGCCALILSYLQKQGEQPSAERVKQLLYENSKKLADEYGNPYNVYEAGQGLVQVNQCLSSGGRKGAIKKPTQPAIDTNLLNRAKLFRSQELSLINGISGRLGNLVRLQYPDKRIELSDVKVEEEQLLAEQTTDRQAVLYPLLEDSDLTPADIVKHINNFPQNPIRFWRIEAVSWLANKLRTPNLWIGVFCWSPLEDILKGNKTLEPAGIHVIEERIRKIKIDKSIDVVLFAGSTSKWIGNLTPKVDDNVYCLYFFPSDYGGWRHALPVKQMQDSGLDWYIKNLYPEDDDAIDQRIRNWFKEAGNSQNRWTLEDAAEAAGSPIQNMHDFFEELNRMNPKMWSYYPNEERLIKSYG